MTPEQLRQNAAAMLAFADGKPVQILHEQKGWIDNPSNDLVDIDTIEYRPKPEPVTRHWSKPEDVPINCWIRWTEDGNQYLVTAILDKGVQCKWDGSRYTSTWDALRAGGVKHSTDRKEWKPCVTEAP